MTNSQTTLNVGIRGSELSVRQTEHMLAYLKNILPSIDCNIVKLTTPGDRDRNTDLRITETDFFSRDIDEAVLKGEVDFGIHSAKDCPYPAPQGLDWFWAPHYEDRRDVIITKKGVKISDLPENPVIGVSSDRREKYSLERFPEGKLKSIRGDIKTRIEKLDNGEYDLIITALAAINRLGIADRVTEVIPLSALETPDGQGKLCISFKENDKRFIELRKLFNPPVIFAGSGIGALDNITVSAKTALQECEICLHDSLINKKVLNFINNDAQIVNVGKRCGKHSHDQQTISELIAYYARTGRKIVRLKGGDPTVFGRIDEELTILENLQIPYKILPGITSLQVTAAENRILLTKRGTSLGFTALTARNKDAEAVDIASLTKQDLPLVIYMGTKIISQLTDNLIKSKSIKEDTPVAVIFGAGSSEQFTITGVISNIAERVKEAETKLPGLIIIGQNILDADRNKYHLLSDRKVLLTGSEAIIGKAAAAVESFGGKAIELPLIKQVPCLALTDILEDIKNADWLVITSPGSAKIFFEKMKKEKIDCRQIPHVAVCGNKTAEIFIANGIYPEIIPEENFSAEALQAEILKKIPKDSKIIRFRSDVAGSKMADFLQANSYQVSEHILYRTEGIKYDYLPEFDSIFFASKSAVIKFIENFGAEKLVNKQISAIGKPTEKALNDIGINKIIIGCKATCEAAITALAADHVLIRFNASKKYSAGDARNPFLP